jgi:hypothetical protein
MRKRDSRIFDEAVARFFAPVATRLGLPVQRIAVGVHEVSSPWFIMRVRLHTGHHRGLNVLLRPASQREFDENEPGTELGIGNFAQFAGEDWNEPLIETDSGFMDRAESLASAAERHLAPYLLGQKNDFSAVQEMVSERTRIAVEQIKKYRFPRNVRKKWK